MSADAYIASGILELYVSGVLNPEEMQEVRMKADANKSIKAELAKIELSFARYAELQYTGFQPNVLDTVLMKLDETPEVQPAAATSKKSAAKQAAQSAKTVKMVAAQHEQPLPRKRGSGIKTFLLIITLLLLVLSALFNYFLYTQWQQVNEQETSLQVYNDSLLQQLELQKASQSQSFSLLNIYADPNFQEINLKVSGTNSAVAGTVLWNRKDQSVYFSPLELPAPPQDKIYRLWAQQEDETYILIGDINETNKYRVNTMKPVSQANAFILNLESDTAATQPTPESIFAQGNI